MGGFFHDSLFTRIIRDECLVSYLREIPNYACAESASEVEM